MIRENDIKSLFYIISVTLGVIFVSSSLFYILELEQNKNVSNLFDSVWWSVVTLTSLGYGDIFPVTVGGRIIGMFLMFFGIGLIGVIAGSVSRHYFEERRSTKKE
jgi:voltage-gated potassium channel